MPASTLPFRRSRGRGDEVGGVDGVHDALLWHSHLCSLPRLLPLAVALSQVIVPLRAHLRRELCLPRRLVRIFGGDLCELVLAKFTYHNLSSIAVICK